MKELLPTGFEMPKNVTHHFEAKGCQHCYYTGYSGRKAIYEILPIDKELMKSIKNNLLDIDDYLIANEVHTLRTNAIYLIKNGTTSVEEVFSLLMD